MRVTTRFLPVGQGLFSAGTLEEASLTRDFRWVYDCGTLSKRALLDQHIKEVQAQAREDLSSRPSFGMVVLSHFDADHISGIVSLMTGSTVDILLLPYMTLAQRLIIARAEGIDVEDPLIQFYLNPVGYLAQQKDLDIRRIVLVQGGSQEPSADKPQPADTRPDDNAPPGLTFETADPKGEDETSDLAAFKRASPAAVSLLELGGALKHTARVTEGVPAGWEIGTGGGPFPAPSTRFRTGTPGCRPTADRLFGPAIAAPPRRLEIRVGRL